MPARTSIGKISLILGPIFCFVWMWICFAGAMLLKVATSATLPDILTLAVSAAVVGLLIGAVGTLGGWLLTHPAAGAKIQKPLGWFLMILGICGVALPIAGYIYGLIFLQFVAILYCGFTVYEGWLLTYPVKKGKGRKRIVATFQSPSEPDKQSGNPSGGL